MFRKVYSLTLLLCALLAAAGCGAKHSAEESAPGAVGGPRATVNAAAREYASQKTYDPWVLTTSSLAGADVPMYIGTGRVGYVASGDGTVVARTAGDFVNGSLAAGKPVAGLKPTGQVTLDMRSGKATGVSVSPAQPIDWPSIWKTSDIEIGGDPMAQQVTHANMFYLLEYTERNGQDSVAPMGLSSGIYNGHIFWDADVWMLPALIVQHPDFARSIVNYRYRLLGQAKKNAAAHGFAGAEYPWESADTGKEEAPVEFAGERHITSDIAFATWQYYLWTGDKAFLKSEGWPILQQTATYWISRLAMGADGKYHIKGVLSPDETAGTVDDDAWTNAVVAYNLRAAVAAAGDCGQVADPQWVTIANKIYLPYNSAGRYFDENDKTKAANYQAKQADAQLLIYPLDVSMPPDAVAGTLDYWLAHTIKVGPAMTSSINAIIAARLDRSQQSLDLFRDSYLPFERTGLCAFSEKRTTDRTYFCTGMGGCLQTVLYGFAGLNVAGPGETGRGKAIAGSGNAALFADPKLPPGWTGLTIHGIQFRGKVYTLKVGPGNATSVTSGS